MRLHRAALAAAVRRSRIRLRLCPSRRDLMVVAAIGAALCGPGLGAGLAQGAATSPGRSSGFGQGLSLTDSDAPIEVKSDELEFDYQNDRVIYRGKVHVRQADLNIDCTELVVTYTRAQDDKKAELREVVATGDVVILQGTRRGTGRKAVFDQIKRQIVLSGDPVLHDGPNEVSGERIVVFVDEGRSVVESGPEKRVSATLYPKGAPGAEANAAEGKPAAGAAGAKDAKAAAKAAPGARTSAGSKAAAPAASAAGRSQ